GDPVAGQAAVGLDLRLPRSTGADPAVYAPRAEPLEVRPQPAHAGKVVLELGQLDLELALGRVGVVGEDVEDHRGAIDHGDAEGPLLRAPGAFRAAVARLRPASIATAVHSRQL